MAQDTKQKEVEAQFAQDDGKTQSTAIAAAKAGIDGDEALKFLAGATTLTAGELSGVVDEKALVRKIDWMIIPLMWCCYCLQYLDKTLSCLIAFLPAENKIGRLIGIYIMNDIVAGLPLMYAYVSANVAGHTKKVTMNAVLLIT